MKKRNWIEEKICAMGAWKIKIPRSIIIDGDEDEDIVRLTLNANRLQTKNMQEDGLFTLNEQVKGGKSHRGYEELLKLKEEKSIKIQGIMLADDFHPCVKDCCEELNKNNMGSIQYSVSSYRLNVVIDKYDL